VPARSLGPAVGEHVDRLADCDERCESECAASDGRGGGFCPAGCSHDADCGPNTLCVFTGSFRRCLGSQCSGFGADAECAGRASCAIEAHEEGAIFRCTRAGERKLGEPCGSVRASETALCEIGLSCANGRCLPQSCERNDQCPHGSVCASFAAGLGLKSCSPSCASDADCPDDDLCLTVAEGPFAERECFRHASARTCPAQGCPSGQVCQVRSRRYWRFAAACVIPCSGDDSACPTDSFCGRVEGAAPSLPFRCYPRCHPDDPGSCADGLQCTEKAPGQFTCRSDYEAAERAFFSSPEAIGRAR
jgi:hypothetical protein